MYYSLALTDSIGGLWESVTGWINVLLMAVINILPDSPFQSITIPSAVSDVIGYMNYILPVAQIAYTTLAWVTCVLGYYVIKVVLNWLKAINS